MTLTLFTAAWLFASQAASTRTPGGIVVDARTGAPVARAEVSIAGAPGVARTGDDGRFVWTTMPLSAMTPASVVITLDDGRVARAVLIAPATSNGPLRIAVEPIVRDAVAVVGVSGAIDTSSGAAMTRLPRGDVEMRHPATLAQVLELIPGVSAIAEGQGAVPVIRGLGRGRTLILVDGARAGSERRAGPNASFVDPATMRAAAVARGPASVAYGSDAMGGVIALELDRPDVARGWHGRLAGALGAGVPEQGGQIEIGRGYGSGALAIGVRAREFDDYESPFGVVPHSSWRDRGAHVSWQQAIGRSWISARWQSDLGRDLGRPRSDSHVMRVTSPIDDSHRLTVSWQRAVAGAFRHLRVDALFGASTQQTDQDRLATAAPARARSLESSETSHRDVQVRAVGERAVGAARVQAGVDLQGRYGLGTTDTVHSFNLAGAETSAVATVSIDDARRTGAGAFVDVALPIGPRMQASLGGRVDTVRNDNRGGFWGDRSTSNAAFAGAASLTAVPSDGVQLTAQVGRGFRDPTLTDRFYRGPVGRGIVEGNPDLAPETSLQVDVAARVTRGRVRAELSAYRYRVNDLIERYAVSTNLFRYRNRVDARFQGVELAGALSLPRGFSLEIAAQASRGRDGADDTPLDDVAPVSVSAIVRHAAGARVSSYLRVAAYRAHDAAGPSEIPVPGYEVVDAGASWRISANLRAHALLRNLFDGAYYGSAGPRWVYAPGRQAVTTLSLTF